MITFDAVRLKGLTDINLPIIGLSAKDPYRVTAIDGLGPPELEVLLAETHAPGGIYINRRAQGREIVIRLGLNPDYRIGQTIADLRYALYGLLSTGVDSRDQSVKCQLMENNVVVVETSGYVKRIEIVPFDKKPQAQITIACLGPYLNRPAATDYKGYMGGSYFTVSNAGLAPTGVELNVKFLASLSNFTINISGGSAMTFEGPFEVDDILVVDTNEATRFVGLLRNDEYVKYMEMLTPESDWIGLHGGDHDVQYSDPWAIEWLYFRYHERFWGI